MPSIFLILYLILLLIYVIAAIIIVYHVARFSYKKSAMTLTIGVFLSVFGVLLLINFLSFLAIEWQDLFPLINS